MKAVEFDSATGITRITIRNETWVVEAPLLGEMRELDTLAAELDSKAKSEMEQRIADAIEAEDEEADVRDGAAVERLDEETRKFAETRTISESVPEVLPWWRRLFELCADKPLPEDDKCPLWMGSTLLVTRIQLHWTMHPFVDPGAALSPPTVQ